MNENSNSEDNPTQTLCRSAHCRSIQFKAGKISVRKKPLKSLDGQRLLFSDDICRAPKKKPVE
jgi:hypothetical protein